MVFLSFLSAIAGVYSEVLLKGTQDNVWWQQVLLYAWTFFFCVASNFFSSSGTADGDAAHRGKSFFSGFTTYVWVTILLKSLYGQVIGLVFRYADNIVKIYANSLSQIASAVLCFLFFGDSISTKILLSGCLVVQATILYYTDHSKLLERDTSCFDRP